MSHPEPQDNPISGRSVVIVVIVVFVVAAILAVAGIVPRLRAQKRLQKNTDALAAPDVMVAKPQMGQPTEEVVLPGSMQAYVDSPIYARTNGYLKKWYFDIGARVHKGQLLAVIESPEIDQQLAQAQADLLTTEATQKNAQTTSARYQALLKENAVTAQDTENFATQAAASNTQVKSALANVNRLRQMVAFEKVYAPFTGTITARNIDVGQLINSGTANELFHLAQENVLRVYINVPQIDSRAAVKGTTADITLPEYPGRRFQGKIVRTSDAIDPNSRTLLVEVDVDNRRHTLIPGSYVQVHLKLNNDRPTLIIPVPTMIFRAEGLRVATVVNGKAKLVPITIGQDDGKVVQVVEGLNPNDEVIQNPPDSIIDGEIVHIVQPHHQNPQAQPGGKS